MIRRKKFVTPTEIHSKRDDNQFVDCGYTNKVLLWSTHEEKFAIIHRANEKKRTAHNLKTTYRKKKLHCYTALNGKSKLSAICRRTKAREIFVITMRMSVMRVEGEGGKTHPSFRAFSYITTTPSPDDIRKKKLMPFKHSRQQHKKNNNHHHRRRCRRQAKSNPDYIYCALGMRATFVLSGLTDRYKRIRKGSHIRKH